MPSQDSNASLTRKIKDLEEENRRLESQLYHYQQNEERFQRLLNSTEEGYFEVNLAGDMMFFNDAVCEIFGYSREELKGKNNREYTAPETAGRMYQIFNQVFQTGKPAEITDYEIIRKNGEHRFLELSTYLIYDENGRAAGFGGVGRDVTERKKNEISLRESDERFRRLQEATFGGICIHDQGRIIDCNKELARMTGYSQDELIGMDGRKLAAPEWRETLQKKIVSTDENQYDLVGLAKDGLRIPLEIRSKTIPYHGKTVRVAEFRDISDRKKYEEALRKSRVRYRELYKEAHQAEELYQSLLDSSPDAIVLLDAEQSVQYINSAFTQLFGWTQDSLKNKATPYIPHPQKNWFKEFIHELLEEGAPVRGLESQILTRHGRFLDVSISAARYLDYKGYPAGALIIFRDITEAKRYQWHMYQAQKMESIGTMAGGIAHDFNNLLMGIQGRLSLIMMQMNSGGMTYGHLKDIEDYSVRAAELTQQLLEFSRAENVEATPTDINELVHTQAQLFGRTRKELTIHEDFAGDLWAAEVNPRQVDQVLLNIFVNAAHAMPDGGDLYVKTLNEVLSSDRTQPYDAEPGNYVKISITDTGVGMDPVIQRRVFEPFFTTKERGRGTGLGLASAYSIIKNHGGFITIYSVKGKGSTFNIYLPASVRESEAKAAASQELVSGAGTILLVDDEEMIIEVGEEMLRTLGYDVLIARRGSEAVEILENDPKSVHMVILDLIMPEMNGSETFDRLRSVKPDVKVLLSSGYSLNGQADEVMQRGCNGFIQKPFNLVELSQKLYNIINEAN
ncbi:MAG TPA: PAS domain S-box protein [Desulfosalsimonadaceae bacterium]|nr:PAS domain S-box protein [Desulfosalsimonadaceae bacterium]